MRFRDESQISYTNLTFESGKTYALLGASGCGKSTLLNLDRRRAHAARRQRLYRRLGHLRRQQKARDAFHIQNIGYIFQDFKLLEDMRVSDNIGILKLENIDISGMDALLERLGILALKSRKVRNLSGGEKQRVCIARALVKRPAILLADEPTGNLNYAIGRSVMEALLDAARGKTLLCVTHDERLCPLFDETIDMNAVASFCAKEGVQNA